VNNNIPTGRPNNTGHFASRRAFAVTMTGEDPISSMPSNRRSRYLQIYLNDHLAGATAGRALARRAHRNALTSEIRGSLERLADEIDADRETLLDIMHRVGAKGDPIKVAFGLLSERLGRLKLNGHLFQPTPLTQLHEVETLSLGVEGKIALWRSLRDLSAVGELSERLDVLIDRGEGQRAELERLRTLAHRQAIGQIRKAEVH
jgi:hypothetical protein